MYGEVKLKKNFINEFKNKTILVSGSNGLLGKKLVKTLLKLNSNIIALDLKLPKKKINNKNIIYRACDVTDFKNVEKVTKELRKKKMKLNGLVVAHQYKPQGFLADHNLSKINKYRLWNLVIQSNLTAVYIMLNEFQKLMSKNSSIVVLGSTYGDVSSNPNLYLDNEMGNPAVYSASKAGAAMLARYYGVHLAKKK